MTTKSGLPVMKNGQAQFLSRADPFFFAGLPDFSYPLAANSSLHRVDRHITTLLPPTM